MPTKTWRQLPILLFIATVLIACTATIAPAWVATFNPKAQEEPDRLAWFDDMEVDSYGNVVVAASTIRASMELHIHDFALVKFDATGNRLWSRVLDLSTSRYKSDDSPLELVLDTADNIYVLVEQFRIVSEQESASGNYLISFDANGNERWRQELGEGTNFRTLTLANNQLYVSGPETRVFNLNGSQLLSFEHPHHVARSVAVNRNGDIALGGGSAVTLFNAQGQQLWHHRLSDRDWAFGETRFTLQGDLVATNALEENGGASLARFSATGELLWFKVFSAAYESYGLPGRPRVFEDYRGDLLLLASNEDGHRIVKLDAAGRVTWNRRGKKMISDAAMRDGDLFIVGGGTNAKYDTDGNRVAESSLREYIQITTGSAAIDGDRLYAGYSANVNGTFVLHLSQYLDQ
ncbi:hypothetical protein LPB19_16455 [Marinobacter salinisoli]|uniref:Pyrrolo-quinoline quinone repeat domain-containing protein n=1 Tax=Marinobacter salinisoli TaxID=2769486 RepID=A0ABX7MR06_9GAMM|nr:PQQ-binding-like beta-propeller repeat protein [Marinobacter salinisoli]QSP94738.1 hypothetical protein LPB19_16455 [Marinobacter salinisoli]